MSARIRSLPGVQGGVVWALVPYDFRTPVVVADHPDGPTTFANVGDLVSDVRDKTLPPEFHVEVGAKIRPVLLLQDRPEGRLKEYAALKLTRIEKLAADAQESVRQQQAKRFFHLPHPARFKLGKEFAIDLLSLVRIHQLAIVAPPQGKLNENEFRVVCERLVRVMDLDIAHMVVREAAAFRKRQGLD